MGLLDDAIREHLELKRRRGADTSEVTRQEQEAFGPPRHGDFELAPAGDAEPVSLHEELALDDGEREPPAHVAEAPAAALHAVEDPPPAQTEPPRPHGDPADDLPEPEPIAEPEPATDPEPVADVSQPTREFDAEEIRAASAPPAAHTPVPPPAAPVPDEPDTAGGAEGDDVLEETPEFLQETPEHDRLWFEQRPPRDFDF